MLPEGDFVNENGDVKHYDLSDGEIPPLENEVNKYINPPVESGVFVSFTDRVIAINGIMHIFNLQNRNRGANSKMGTQDITKRYFDSDSLLRNMDEKERVALKDYEKHLNTLAAVDKFRDAGFSEPDIQSEKELLRAELEHYYGPGNAYARDREKLVKKVQPPETKKTPKRNVLNR